MISLSAAKLIAQVAATLGVTKVVNDVIRNNVNIVTRLDYAKVWTGSLVLGSLVTEQASNHIERVTTTLVEWNEERKNKDKPETEEVS